jgi:hypothetical protein
LKFALLQILTALSLKKKKATSAPEINPDAINKKTNEVN